MIITTLRDIALDFDIEFLLPTKEEDQKQLRDIRIAYTGTGIYTMDNDGVYVYGARATNNFFDRIKITDPEGEL